MTRWNVRRPQNRSDFCSHGVTVYDCIFCLIHDFMQDSWCHIQCQSMTVWLYDLIILIAKKPSTIRSLAKFELQEFKFSDIFRQICFNYHRFFVPFDCHVVPQNSMRMSWQGKRLWTKPWADRAAATTARLGPFIEELVISYYGSCCNTSKRKVRTSPLQRRHPEMFEPPGHYITIPGKHLDHT